MLEAELSVQLGSLRSDTDSDMLSDETLSNDYVLQRRQSFVTYETFLSSYWVHFPHQYVKKLGTCSTQIFVSFSTDFVSQIRCSYLLNLWVISFTLSRVARLSTVFFVGVIKGSEQTLLSETGCLSREDYMNLSHRSRSTFSTQREVIYTLFQKYQRMKAERFDYDAADR